MQDNVVVESRTLLERLRLLGLPGPELDLYFHLERVGPCTPSALANALQLSPEEIDELLEGLMAKGLVSSTFRHELRFEATPFQAVAVDDI